MFHIMRFQPHTCVTEWFSTSEPYLLSLLHLPLTFRESTFWNDIQTALTGTLLFCFFAFRLFSEEGAVTESNSMQMYELRVHATCSSFRVTPFCPFIHTRNRKETQTTMERWRTYVFKSKCLNFYTHIKTAEPCHTKMFLQFTVNINSRKSRMMTSK